VSEPRDDPEGPAPRRRSGRRREPLEHIALRGDRADRSAESDDEPEDEPDREIGPSPSSRESPRRIGSGAGRGRASRGAGLDRIRPRGSGGSDADSLEPADLADDDPHGRLALYSSSEQRAPALGTFIVECSACRRETPVGAGDLVRAGIPSVHLPLVKRYPSFMRCPACGRRTWVRVRWRL